jgi:hypothetical protein
MRKPTTRTIDSATIIVLISLAVIIATAACCCLVCISLPLWVGNIQEKVAEIDVGNNRFVSIRAEWWWEVGRLTYYSARSAGKVVVPTTFLGFDDGKNNYTFQIVTAENQSLVGVFDPNKSVFIIIDFKTGESWPQSMTPMDKYLKAKQKALELFGRLQKENPGLVRPEGLTP